MNMKNILKIKYIKIFKTKIHILVLLSSTQNKFPTRINTQITSIRQLKFAQMVKVVSQCYSVNKDTAVRHIIIISIKK